MPRLACPEDPGVALHLVQRGRGRAPCFSGPADRIAYLDGLRDAARRSACPVHAYALMGNHVHLLVTPGCEGGAGELMRSAAEGYARHLARTHGHEAGVWEDGYDGTPVHARKYLFACMRYIELNPVRAGLVREAAAYRWSSYRANAQGEENALVTPHPVYFALGRSREERCAAYRALFGPPLRSFS
jgi:REP-associated tyrosine transposase